MSYIDMLMTDRQTDRQTDKVKSVLFCVHNFIRNDKGTKQI